MKNCTESVWISRDACTCHKVHSMSCSYKYSVVTRVSFQSLDHERFKTRKCRMMNRYLQIKLWKAITLIRNSIRKPLLQRKPPHILRFVPDSSVRNTLSVIVVAPWHCSTLFCDADCSRSITRVHGFSYDYRQWNPNLKHKDVLRRTSCAFFSLDIVY